MCLIFQNPRDFKFLEYECWLVRRKNKYFPRMNLVIKNMIWNIFHLLANNGSPLFKLSFCEALSFIDCRQEFFWKSGETATSKIIVINLYKSLINYWRFRNKNLQSCLRIRIKSPSWNMSAWDMLNYWKSTQIYYHIKFRMGITELIIVVVTIIEESQFLDKCMSYTRD